MGKRIDQLAGLDDTPFDDAPDPRPTTWARFSRDIEDLIGTGLYTWAEETLRGIQDTVERTHQVTDAQRRAVANIEASAHKTGSRRYEGFRRERW